MDEFAAKGMELMGRDDGDIRKRSCISFNITGYDDTSLGEYDLTRALRKHFASCGWIKRFHIPRDVVTSTLDSVAFMEIQGDEGTGQKVLELNGSDVGGWNVVVNPLPNQGPDSAFCPKAAAFRAQSKRKNQSIFFLVSGFDTSLPEAYIEHSLSECFSSCGEITGISLNRGVGGVLKSSAFIYILGEGASEKALKLNGSDAGGWKVSVRLLTLPQNNSAVINNRRRCFGISVTGYDTSLPEDDLKSALSKHFRSCGEVMDISISRSDRKALIYIMGEGAGEKALELSGSYMEGCNVVAKVDSVPDKSFGYRRFLQGCPDTKKAKMTTEYP